MFAPAFVRSLALVALPLAGWAGLQESKPAPSAVSRPMQAWHVLFEMGPKYDPKIDAMAQPGFSDHFQRVHKLADEGKLLLGGPLIDDLEGGKLTGAVMIMLAKDDKEVRDTLAADAFISGDVIKIASVRPFIVGAGAWMPKEKDGAGFAR